MLGHDACPSSRASAYDAETADDHDHTGAAARPDHDGRHNHHTNHGHDHDDHHHDDYYNHDDNAVSELPPLIPGLLYSAAPA